MDVDGDITGGLRRARRTAAIGRALMATVGIVIALAWPGAIVASPVAVVGLGLLLVTALVQLALPRSSLLVVEETVAPVSALLIVGLGPERITAVGVVWLCSVACGVLARGGRQHWYGRAVLVVALALPFVRHGAVTPKYVIFCVATIVLLLACGRVTHELRTLLRRARHEADHDPLTGLLTRRTFAAALERVAIAAAHGEAAASRPTALLLVDLDGFRAVNKSSGHAAGDAILRSVAERIGVAVGADGVAGRLGGDEFGAILHAADARAVAEALLAGLAAEPGVRASAGMVVVDSGTDDAEGLLRAVDVALRVAKRSRSQRLSVYAGEALPRSGPSAARRTLERLLDGDGLTVAVQPIVTVADRAPHAYEALARFAVGSTADPLHWFALAEELGLRDELEIACLRAALAVFPDRPAGSSLTVNLSGPLLRDHRVVDLLQRLPTLEGLILEITENSLLEDSAGMHAAISRLRERGLRFAIDDMGVGYSGLRQVMTLRPTYLKLDRSLVTGIDADPERAALVAAMVGYAAQTGGHLVAEGVETASELAALAALGVSLVQGYHLARPGWPWPEVAPAPDRDRSHVVTASRTTVGS